MMPYPGLPIKPIRFILVPILLTLFAFVAAADQNVWVRVKWVADGDTIILHDGRHIRYIGIDTPEIDQRKQRDEPLARKARSVNRQLVEGWRLRLVYDQEKNDRYGRVLAYVYRSDGLFVNAELIRRGLAHILYKKPNTSKAQLLLSVQRDAMKAGQPIWQFVKKDQKPSRPYRGNRSSKRFHTHDCPMGKNMSKKNQVWLENQWAAFGSGYAPARGCIKFPEGK